MADATTENIVPQRLRRAFLAVSTLAMTTVTGCYATVHETKTSDLDPGALAIQNYWFGLFWVVVVISCAVIAVAWALAWAIVESRKH